MPKPLAGIRVIELANFIAGPLAGTLLADMGADVVKVEPPGGDMSRATPPIRNNESVSFVALNRNKRSLVLDLKRPEAIEILRKLAGKSDVFLEAYRPGALDKLGLGAADVKAINPRIVYTSVSGFGQSGPDRRRAGVNLIIEAFSGVLSVTGEPGQMPMRPGVQSADVFGALFATYATLAGLAVFWIVWLLLIIFYGRPKAAPPAAAAPPEPTLAEIRQPELWIDRMGVATTTV